MTAMNAKLYYYTDFAGTFGWYANAREWHKANPQAGSPVRICAQGVEPPPGYRKTGPLANHPAERIPTMRDFVEALS